MGPLVAVRFAARETMSSSEKVPFVLPTGTGIEQFIDRTGSDDSVVPCAAEKKGSGTLLMLFWVMEKSSKMEFFVGRETHAPETEICCCCCCC